MRFQYSNHAKVLAAAMVLMPTASALAAVALPPAGDTLLDGSFINLSYGTNGTAALSPLLFVGDLANTQPVATQVLTTNLAYGYAVGGSGTSLFSVVYSITNVDSLPFTDLRFMAVVQPDGGARRPAPSALDTGSESGFGAPKAPGDPDKRELFARLPASTLVTKTTAANGVADGSNNCAAAGCDLEMALEWDLPVLNPNETWRITLNLSDNPTSSANRWVRSTAVDPADSMLTLSGDAAVVPEPSAYATLFAGLGLLALARRFMGRASKPNT